MQSEILEAMRAKKVIDEDELAEKVGGDRDEFGRHMATFHADGSIWRGTDGTKPMCTLASHLAILNGEEEPEATPIQKPPATLSNIVAAIDRLADAIDRQTDAIREA